MYWIDGRGESSQAGRLPWDTITPRWPWMKRDTDSSLGAEAEASSSSTRKRVRNSAPCRWRQALMTWFSTLPPGGFMRRAVVAAVWLIYTLRTRITTVSWLVCRRGQWAKRLYYQINCMRILSPFLVMEVRMPRSWYTPYIRFPKAQCPSCIGRLFSKEWSCETRAAGDASHPK